MGYNYETRHLLAQHQSIVRQKNVNIKKENPSYIVLYKNEIYTKKCGKLGNQFPLSYDEAIQAQKELKGSKIINISRDLEAYTIYDDMNMKKLLEPLQYDVFKWRSAFFDNNLNGFTLPLRAASNRAYLVDLKKVLKKYCKAINVIAFKYEDSLRKDIENICNSILNALYAATHNHEEQAKKILMNLIKKYINDEFWVSELDKSYAFRGIAPFSKLYYQHNALPYDKMLDGDITLYRARTKEKGSVEEITHICHMLHLPYNIKNKASKMRFSIQGQPCLYLGTTSLVCSNECHFNEEKEDLYISSFIPTEEGKKLRILNLAVSQALINGIYNKSQENKSVNHSLQNSMLKIFPLIIATSYTIRDNQRRKRKQKYEYLLSQLLMQIINDLEIDGIAYLSRQGKDDFQYPHGVNLALPAKNISKMHQYCDYCKLFKITKPVSKKEIDPKKVNLEKRSFINQNYPQYDEYQIKEYMATVNYNGRNIFYGETPYSKIDDYMINQQSYIYNE